MANQRRPLTDRIDIFFLLKQQKLITRKEFNDKLPSQSYDDYRSTYYRRRVSEAFDKHSKKEWFIFRYLDDFFHEERRKTISSIHSFERPGPCIVARNIPDDIPGRVICSVAETCPNIGRFWIQQRTSQNGFSRTCYIVLKGEASPLDSIELVNPVASRDLRTRFEEFDVSGAEEPEILFGDCDHKTASLIFDSLCGMFGMDRAEILEKYAGVVGERRGTLDSNTAEFMCNALKDVFLYCYTCAHQYDTPLEMMLGCRNHKATEAAVRRREFLKEYRGLGYAKTRSVDESLGRMVSTVDENHYKCELCGKAFEGRHFVTNHINNKHADEVEEMRKEIGDFERFVDRIDCFMLGFVEGTDDDRIPGFVECGARDDRVVYNIGRVFSGEIVMKK